ncbi:copper homeostasis periplasmic binding protein CopC [Roseixanthobacter glucoisosaccharinicivorans]|uniref:copper homeostasis periplasmic binding protein CopC n=1 Tax=Roseixanthobacter glucoisosaccharinicivorans TaxID=3119923 RepID=UPI00372B0362
MKRPIAPVLALAFSVLSAGAALAHAHLTTQTPAANDAVAASPSTLSLGFSEGLEIGLSGVTLKEASGQPIPTGKPVLAPGDDKQMSVPLNAPLAAGRYTVEWHALSKDGHTTHGSYSFTVSP